MLQPFGPVEPEAEVRIKTREEVLRTIRRRDSAERGLLANRHLVLITAVSCVSIFFCHPLAALGFMLLAIDFLWFVVRRHRILSEDEKGRPRLESAADFEMVGRAFRKAGLAEPTMTDYEKVAGLSIRGWANDLRYRYLLPLYSGGTVADIGCGDGRLCWKYKICAPENYIGLDIGHSLIQCLMEKTGGKARGVVAVAQATTIEDSSVDLLVCSESFEHLPDPGEALREFVRIVKPGGKIVIQSPSAYAVRNLNPFHVLNTFLGRIAPAVLQRKVVHENTFVHACTYHWDFTRQDFRNYCRDLALKVLCFAAFTYRFNPEGSRWHRAVYRLAKLPLISNLWRDMTIVLQKM